MHILFSHNSSNVKKLRFFDANKVHTFIFISEYFGYFKLNIYIYNYIKFDLKRLR